MRSWYILVIGIVLISGCKKKDSSQSGAPLTDAQRTAISRLENARDRLVVSIGRLIRDPNVAIQLCNRRICGNDPYTCQNLASVVGDPDKLDFLRKKHFTPERLIEVRDALTKLRFRASEEPADLALNEEGQDAFTSGFDVVAHTTKTLKKTDSELLGVVGHEVQHALGDIDAGFGGAFADHRAEIDGKSACFVTLTKGVETDSRVLQWELVDKDDFHSATSSENVFPLSSRWKAPFLNPQSNINPIFSVMSNMVALGHSTTNEKHFAELKGRVIKNTRLSARVFSYEQENGEKSAGRLVARKVRDDVYYAASLYGNIHPELRLEWFFAGASYVLRSVNLERSQDMFRIRFELEDKNIRIYVNDKLEIEYVDTNILEPGKLGLEVGPNSVVQFDDFQLEKISGAD